MICTTELADSEALRFACWPLRDMDNRNTGSPTTARFLLGRQSSLAPSDGSSHSRPDGNDSVNPEAPESKLQLLYLAHQGDVDGIHVLLDHGVDVNFADFDNRTALHVAACDGNVKVVSLLLSKGANVNAQDRWGSTPLADACHYRNEVVCKLLSKSGAKLNKVGHEGSMRVLDPLEIPDYEVNPEDLSDNITVTKKGYQVAIWRGIKVFVKCLQDSFVYGETDLIAFRSELALLQKLRHPNIVQFLGAVTQRNPMMIIFEYLPQGDLYDYLRKKGGLKTSKAIDFALDIARGLNYMHEHKPDAIVHRDLKPKNILRDESGHLKVADLGLSKALKITSATIREDGSFPLKGSSCRYLAPEVFKNKAYGRTVDVFAFGLILQEMIEGHAPLHQMENKNVPAAFADKNMRPSFKASPRHYPGDLKKLIEECWDTDPLKRPTFMDIIDRLERIRDKHMRSIVWKISNLWRTARI